MKKLIVSGCSFTTDNYISVFHPHMDTGWKKWPELLGEKLGMEVINLGRSGNGSEYIFSSLCDEICKHNAEDIGLVIAAWSQFQRKDYCLNNRWSSIHNDLKGDWNYFIDRSMRYYYMFQVLCESKNIKYKQFQMIEPIKDYVHELNKRKRTNDIDVRDIAKAIRRNLYYENIDKKHFIGWPANQVLGGYNLQWKVTNNKEIRAYQISMEDTHPNALGHEKYAEFIYENLQYST